MFNSISESGGEVGSSFLLLKRKLKNQYKFQNLLDIPELLKEILNFSQLRELLELSKTSKQFHKQLKTSIPYRNFIFNQKLKKYYLKQFNILKIEILQITELQLSNELFCVKMVHWQKWSYYIEFVLFKDFEIILNLTEDPHENTLWKLKDLGWNYSNVCDSDLNVIMSGMLVPLKKLYHDVNTISISKEPSNYKFKVEILEDIEREGLPNVVVGIKYYKLQFNEDSIMIVE
jgi:hypothetical protein